MHKPDVVQKAKFEYSPLGQVFNKGLDTSDKKEGLLKKLKYIEGKNEQQLEVIRDQGEKQLEVIKDFSASSEQKEIKFGDEETQESKILRHEINKIDRINRNKKLTMVQEKQEKQTNEDKEQTEEEQIEEKTIPDWVNISNYAFRRIQKDVDECIKKV